MKYSGGKDLSTANSDIKNTENDLKIFMTVRFWSIVFITLSFWDFLTYSSFVSSYKESLEATTHRVLLDSLVSIMLIGSFIISMKAIKYLLNSIREEHSK